MKQKTIKILTTIVISIALISTSISSFAALNFNPLELEGNAPTNGANKIQSVGNSVVGILQTVGIVLSVVILIILGIKYMMGSSEEKAEYKKTMIPYIVGAALIFAASVLANVVFEFFTNIK